MKRIWTKEEAMFARNNYGPLTAAQIGEKLGRSELSVRKFMGRFDDWRIRNKVKP